MTGETLVYGIIGDPIRQSVTPAAMNARMTHAGRNAVLVPIHVRPPEFETAISGLFSIENLHGLVVTFPYKTRMLPFLNTLLPAAHHSQAVNIIRREPSGGWTGEMLDGRGLARGLIEAGYDVAGCAVAVIGAGGAGAAVAFALAEGGAASINLMDVDTERKVRVASTLKAAHPGCEIKLDTGLDGQGLVVNCTPLGMKDDDPLPADLSAAAAGATVVDIVVRDSTRFLRHAEKLSCRCLGYRTMTEGQRTLMMEFWGL